MWLHKTRRGHHAGDIASVPCEVSSAQWLQHEKLQLADGKILQDAAAWERPRTQTLGASTSACPSSGAWRRCVVPHLCVDWINSTPVVFAHIMSECCGIRQSALRLTLNLEREMEHLARQYIHADTVMQLWAAGGGEQEGAVESFSSLGT